MSRARFRAAAAAAVLALIAAVPGGSAARAASAAPTCATQPGGGLDFYPTTTMMHIHADQIDTTGLRNVTASYGGTITLANCTQVTVTHFRATQLQLHNLQLTSDAGTGKYAVSISSPGTSVIGGFAQDGTAMTTDFWGTLNHITLLPGCPSLLNWDWGAIASWASGFLPISANAYCFDADIYAIEAFHAGGGSALDNPVNIPGTLSEVPK